MSDDVYSLNVLCREFLGDRDGYEEGVGREKLYGFMDEVEEYEGKRSIGVDEYVRKFWSCRRGWSGKGRRSCRWGKWWRLSRRRNRLARRRKRWCRRLRRMRERRPGRL